MPMYGTNSSRRSPSLNGRATRPFGVLLALLMLDKNEKTRGAKNAGKTGRSPNLVAGGEWRADSTHNQLIAVTNSGQKPVETLLSLHYANGEKIYEMQQTIAPGDQMWVNL